MFDAAKFPENHRKSIKQNMCWKVVATQIFFYFHPFSSLFGEDEPILTIILFKWVVQPPTSLEGPNLDVCSSSDRRPMTPLVATARTLGEDESISMS